MSGRRRYPLYIGFLPAKDIASIAEAPSFTPGASHESVATQILVPPTKDWQRPLDMDRVANIRRIFKGDGALMPNPVLLSENGVSKPTIDIQQEKASGSVPTNNWLVEIDPGKPGSRPLWILDGQHRIQGLAASAQSENPIPFVLLINDAARSDYTGADFAKIFAQVTTTAKGLDELHQEWLTYAYQLETYGELHPEAAEHRHAMEIVACMCKRPNLTDGSANPFHDGIRFNPLNSHARRDGFRYGCATLKAMTFKHFSCASARTLEPDIVANELGLASNALRRVVTAPQEESVFFGTGDFGQVPMQDAFVIGALEHLKAHGVPDDWEHILRDLNFDATDWNFKSWISSLQGKAGNESRRLAERVFTQMFVDWAAVPGTKNIADYFKGNGAQLQLIFSEISSSGRPLKTGRESLDLIRGANVSYTTGPRLHVKVGPAWRTGNVVTLDVYDVKSAPGRPIKYQRITGGGIVLSDLPGNEVGLVFRMAHYGAMTSQADVTIKW